MRVLDKITDPSPITGEVLPLAVDITDLEDGRMDFNWPDYMIGCTCINNPSIILRITNYICLTNNTWVSNICCRLRFVLNFWLDFIRKCHHYFSCNLLSWFWKIPPFRIANDFKHRCFEWPDSPQWLHAKVLFSRVDWLLRFFIEPNDGPRGV